MNVDKKRLQSKYIKIKNRSVAKNVSSTRIFNATKFLFLTKYINVLTCKTTTYEHRCIPQAANQLICENGLCLGGPPSFHVVGVLFVLAICRQ